MTRDSYCAACGPKKGRCVEHHGGSHFDQAGHFWDWTPKQRRKVP
jgi:hypothetical protein